MNTITETKTFGQLTQGTVVNFYRSVTADDTNFVVLRQYAHNMGLLFTEVLNLSTFEKDQNMCEQREKWPMLFSSYGRNVLL